GVTLQLVSDQGDAAVVPLAWWRVWIGAGDGNGCELATELLRNSSSETTVCAPLYRDDKSAYGQPSVLPKRGELIATQAPSGENPAWPLLPQRARKFLPSTPQPPL